jgi:hypothetical protein
VVGGGIFASLLGFLRGSWKSGVQRVVFCGEVVVNCVVDVVLLHHVFRRRKIGQVLQLFFADVWVVGWGNDNGKGNCEIRGSPLRCSR